MIFSAPIPSKISGNLPTLKGHLCFGNNVSLVGEKMFIMRPRQYMTHFIFIQIKKLENVISKDDPRKEARSFLHTKLVSLLIFSKHSR